MSESSSCDIVVDPALAGKTQELLDDWGWNKKGGRTVIESNTCALCRHYHLQPRQRGPQGEIDLSAPQTGECRLEVLSQIFILNGQPTPVSVYPPLPPEWPACSHFNPTEEK